MEKRFQILILIIASLVLVMAPRINGYFKILDAMAKMQGTFLGQEIAEAFQYMTAELCGLTALFSSLIYVVLSVNFTPETVRKQSKYEKELEKATRQAQEPK